MEAEERLDALRAVGGLRMMAVDFARWEGAYCSSDGGRRGEESKGSMPHQDGRS